jgi:hypothetical protein
MSCGGLPCVDVSVQTYYAKPTRISLEKAFTPVPVLLPARPAQLPLHLRKTNLARLLARRADGIHLAPFEEGEIGPVLFRAARDMMLEGLVSKRRDSRYRRVLRGPLGLSSSSRLVRADRVIE